MAEEKVKECLFPGCETEQRTRGLCSSHYNVAVRLVKSGVATWEELEERGKVLKARKSRNAEFEDWLTSTLPD